MFSESFVPANDDDDDDCVENVLISSTLHCDPSLLFVMVGVPTAAVAVLAATTAAAATVVILLSSLIELSITLSKSVCLTNELVERETHFGCV